MSREQLLAGISPGTEAELHRLIAVGEIDEIVSGYPTRGAGETVDSLVNWFAETASRCSTIPLLQTISSGSADVRAWVAYLVPRFQDANRTVDEGQEMTLFESVLQATAENAEHHGLQSAAAALRENFDEERGVVHGVRQERLAHATWRRTFWTSMHAVLLERGVQDDALQPREPTPESQNYAWFMQSLLEEARRGEEPWWALGALTMLELCLREEFGNVSEGVRRSFPEISAQAALYVHHHAGHEERHFAELFAAVLQSIAHQQCERDRIIATQGMLNGAMNMYWHKYAVLRSYTPASLYGFSSHTD